MDGKNVLTNTTNYVESVVDRGTNMGLNKEHEMMKQIADVVISQTAKVAILSTKINGVINGTGEIKKRRRRGHACTCARTVSAKSTTRIGTV